MQMHTIGRPQSPASGLAAFLRPPVAPKSLRAALGDEIERMIDLLDALDGDTDFEPDLTGEPNAYNVPCDAEADDSDDEPSLGSLGGTAPFDFMPCEGPYSPTQECWAHGDLHDAELDDSDREPNGDELDFSDHPSGMDGGIGDLEGLEEQAACFDRSEYEGDDIGSWRGFEAVEALRRLKKETRQQALELAARLKPKPCGNLRLIDGFEMLI